MVEVKELQQNNIKANSEKESNMMFKKDINAVKHPMTAPIISDKKKMEKKSLSERRNAVVSNSSEFEFCSP